MAVKAQIYLDYAAATPLDSVVLAAMQPYLSSKFYNPSAGYLAAQQVHKDLEVARAAAAHWFGARPSEIIFTAGGTESNNLAIHGIMRGHPGSNIVVGSIEHESVLAPAHNYPCKEAPVNGQGAVDVAKLNKLINDKTVLVSVMYANNEVGTIQPIREVSGLLASIRIARRKTGNKLPIYLHSDACQAAGYLDLHAARLGVDLMSINGGKIYGPKQSGALYMKAGIALEPLISGGGQERGLRSGTENVGACVGLAAALDGVQTHRHEEAARLQKLQQQFFELIGQKLPAAGINGSRKHRLPNNVHITIPGQDNERLLFALDEAGILAAAGSACSADSGEPSHVLRAMGVTDADARASLRFTMGRHTTAKAVTQAADTLAQLLA
ncbi:MAG TPA: cysteine desulfurase family protein [Patescibacteria group bacterium]|nr:cysteine desulfurase family protein [Patescibacteria group bacterium]